VNVKDNAGDLIDLLDLFRRPSPQRKIFDEISAMLVLALIGYRSKSKVLICGNGGSHADALHFAEEMTGKFSVPIPPQRVMALGANPTHITCTANDFGFDKVFAREVQAYGDEGDVLILLSTSGKSPNLIEAAKAASALGMYCIGFLGSERTVDIELSHRLDKVLYVPSPYPARIQEVHHFLLHCLAEEIVNAYKEQEPL
jgi:phosphoheptose isomerase